MIDSKDLILLGTRLRLLTEEDLVHGASIWFATGGTYQEFWIMNVKHDVRTITIQEIIDYPKIITMALEAVIDSGSCGILEIDPVTLRL